MLEYTLVWQWYILFVHWKYSLHSKSGDNQFF